MLFTMMLRRARTLLVPAYACGLSLAACGDGAISSRPGDASRTEVSETIPIDSLQQGIADTMDSDHGPDASIVDTDDDDDDDASPPIPTDADPDIPTDPAGDAGAVAPLHTLDIDLPQGLALSSLDRTVTAVGPLCCASLTSAFEPLEVWWDNALASQYHREDTSLIGCGPCAGSLDHTLGIRVRLHEHRVLGSDAGFYRSVDSAGRSFLRLAAWLGTCGSTLPCDPSVGRMHRQDLTVHHAASEVVLCAGQRTVSPGLTRCTLDVPAPPYAALGLVASSAWVERDWTTVDGLRIVGYEPAGGRVLAAIDPEALTTFLRWMAGRFGPFPYGNELRVATVPARWLGYEHPANIVLSDQLHTAPVGYTNTPLHTLLHEVAHQWAGDYTSPAALADFAWKEAMAEYLVYVFEDLRSADEARATKEVWHADARFPAVYPRPTDPEPPSIDLLASSAYGLAPLAMFMQLEPLLGRDTVLEGIAIFLRGGGIRGTEALRAAFETAAGRSLRAYFDAWIYGTGEPILPYLKAEWSDAGDGVVQVSVTQLTPDGRIFPCVVEVEVVGDSRTRLARLDFGLDPVSATARTRVDLGEPPRALRLDPNHQLADSPIPPTAALDGGAARSLSPPSPAWWY